MPTAYPLPENLSPAVVSNTASLLRIIALGLISGAAIATRLFAVINFESIIHELYVLYTLVSSLTHLHCSQRSLVQLVRVSTSISRRKFILTCHSRATRVLASKGFDVGPFVLHCPKPLIYLNRNFGTGSIPQRGTPLVASSAVPFTLVSWLQVASYTMSSMR